MTNINPIEIIAELTEMKITETLFSNVTGNRNWSIRTEIDEDGIKRAYIGRFGQLKRDGLFRCSLPLLVKYHVNFLHYTYKKDFDTAVSALKTLGYTIIW